LDRALLGRRPHQLGQLDVGGEHVLDTGRLQVWSPQVGRIVSIVQYILDDPTQSFSENAVHMGAYHVSRLAL
jgi:hypothetical protein